MRYLIAILILVSALNIKAQLLDSIGLFLKEEPRLVVKADLRGSFISNRNVRIVGVKVGYEHGHRFQYGLGYSFLFTPVQQVREVPGQGAITTRLRIGYIAAYVDYAFYQRRNWEVRIPVQLGFGSGSVIYKDTEGRKRKLLRTGLIIYEPAMTVHYKFLKYFAIGGGLGFRLAIRTRDSLDEQITAPTYMFGLKVFFGDIWRAVQSSE
ncbi:MAG: hypothetical protein WAR83_12425 [Flavobacteriales bacterium]|nr:hypothetical protein [Flavobacteriales bacterium]